MASERSVNRMAKNISAKLGVPAKPSSTPKKESLRHKASVPQPFPKKKAQ